MPRQQIKEVMLVFESGKTEHFITPEDIIIANDVHTHTEDDPTKEVFYWTLLITPTSRS